MSFLSRIKRKPRPVWVDAERVYRCLMTQSRTPSFYGHGKAPDNYEGRLEVLIWHIAPLMMVLGQKGEDGERLSQTIFDVMVQDFDVALREEGLSDTGVMHRIKPIIRLFYTRLSALTEATKTIKESEAPVDHDIFGAALNAAPIPDMSEEFLNIISNYIIALRARFEQKSLGEIAQVQFEFPEI